MSDASLPRVEDHHPPFGTPSPNASAQETAVEKSQAAVRKLVEEQTRLSEQMRFLGNLLWEHSAWDQTGRLTSLNPSYRYLFRSPPTKEEVQAVIAKLEKEKENVMDLARGLAMIAQQQGYGGGAVDSSNLTPQLLLRARVEKGAKFASLRRTMYLHAEREGAYYGWFSYNKKNDPVVNETSDFEFVLYFLSAHHMQSMENAVRTWGQQRNAGVITDCKLRNLPFYDRFGVKSDCAQRVFLSDYERRGSPDRTGWDDVCEDYSQSSATTVVDDDQVRNEFVLGDTEGSFVPQSCHILPAAQCTGARMKCGKDPNNRIILDGNLHKLYDQTEPEVSFYCEDADDAFDEHDPQSGTRKEVHLVAFFKSVQIAGTWFRIGFRRGTHETSSHTIHFIIYHKDPKAFVEYLHVRHAKNMVKMGYPEGPPKFSQ
ncbi:hypothetical protein DIPPA_50233 [Diplonema papillatum]|nr:hypothetical protein DIPPA_50233 [Diplonema papillatum]